MTLRRTQSLCPVCLRRVEATYERSAKDALTVVLRKTCPDHGHVQRPRMAGSQARCSAHASLCRMVTAQKPFLPRQSAHANPRWLPL